MEQQFKPPPEMDFSTTDGANVSEKWQKWKQTMELYLKLAMSKKSEKEKCDTFLYIIGQAGRDIYNTMTFTEDESNKLDILFSKFEKYCKPKQNVTVERYQFNTRAQEIDETIDQYVTELKLRAKNCSYGDLEDQLIRDRIVCGTKSEVVKERLLRTEDLTLDKAIAICRADEQSKKHAQYLSEEVNSEPVHGVRFKTSKGRKSGQHTRDSRKQLPSEDQASASHQCEKCGMKHPKKQCPAYGKQCHNCGKQNHFAKLCKGKKKVQLLSQRSETEPSEDTLFIDAVTKQSKTEVKSDECFSTLNVGGTLVRFKIDTGSQANIIPVRELQTLQCQPVIKRSTTKLTSYSGEALCIKGQCTLNCQGHELQFFVVDTDQDPVLSFRASQDLGIIKVVLNVNSSLESYIKQYPTVFEGLGCLSKPYHIQLDPSVKPVVTPLRNQPAALRDRLKATLDEMEKIKVIKKVDQPTEWVNSLVIVEKPKTKKLRVCLDPRPLNVAIQREHFQIPTLDNIATRLTGAKIFSKLDANHGYWQVQLDQESQLLTTFNTPFGRYCFMRMPFGIKSAQEVFQKRLSQYFGDLPGVETDIDDILVWGTNAEEHDQRLHAVLTRCKDIRLTLNKEKCKFGVSEVTYIGHKLTPEGVHPDPDKVKAIKEMPAPSDKKGIERLLGTINYLAKFIPEMSTMTLPIRELLKKDVVFEWQSSQDSAFHKIKETLSAAPVLTFYDVTKPIVITCDASKSGLGAALLQEDKPIAYASRALSDAETRYAQIEKELLAVVFAFHKFHQYVYGKEVQVESDHKPLEMIVRKPLSAAPPRLQRMLLQLQKYTFDLRFKPGKDMVLADTLSRAFISGDPTDTNLEEELACAVHLVVENVPISDARLDEIKQTTKSDATMSTLRATIQDGWPDKMSQVPKEIREFWNFRDELCETDGLILKGGRIVIPPGMRQEILKKLHVSHLGIVKYKERARDVVFWPGMSKAIDEMISKCDTCQEYRASNPKEPMVIGQIPTKPWEIVATDLFSWNGNDYLLLVDYYSRFIELAKLSDTKSQSVIDHSKAIFARHGIPSIVRSDNGPQYSANEYKQFSKAWGFTHITTSPYHSQSNGLAEKSVQIIKRLLSKARQEGTDPYLGLLEYRNTAIDNIGSPAQLSMSRRLRSVIPTTSQHLKPTVIDPSVVIERLKQKQALRKKQYDKGARELPSLRQNEQVRMQVQNHWIPASVVQEASTPNSYVVQTPNGKIYRRNRKHLLKSDNQTNEHSAAGQQLGTLEDLETPMECTNTDESVLLSEAPMPPESTTSRGRVVRTPVRYKDFVRL